MCPSIIQPVFRVLQFNFGTFVSTSVKTSVAVEIIRWDDIFKRFHPFYNLIRCNQILFVIRIIFCGHIEWIEFIHKWMIDCIFIHAWSQAVWIFGQILPGTYRELFEAMMQWWTPLLNQDCSRSDAISLQTSATQNWMGKSNAYDQGNKPCIAGILHQMPKLSLFCMARSNALCIGCLQFQSFLVQNEWSLHECEHDMDLRSSYCKLTRYRRNEGKMDECTLR